MAAGDQAQGLRNLANSGNFSRKAVRCIAVASGKGGVGKTFLAVNLAVALQEFGLKTLLIDADLGLANADIVLGAQPEYTLQDAVLDNRDLSEVVAHAPCGVDLMAASSGTREMVNMGSARMNMLVDQLIQFAANYDVMLFDCAAGIGDSVTSFIRVSPQTLLVTNPQPTSLMDAYALLKLIHMQQISSNVGVVINMTDKPSAGENAWNTLNGVAEKYLSFDLKLFGMVPVSNAVVRALRARKPITLFAENDVASVQIKQIAARIVRNRAATTKIADFDAESFAKGMVQA